jgi:hypothetical protein
VRVTTKFTGNGTNWTHSVADSTYAYHRFDAFGIRPNNLASTAESFTFTNFKVEVLDAEMPPPSPIPLGVSAAGGSVTLTWTDPAFTLESAPEASGTYTNVPNAASPFTVPASQARQFFRLKTTY